jgi:hypothetical protein
MKNVNVQLSFLIRDIRAGGKGHMPPYFGQGYIDLYKSLEWTRKWGTNFEDGPVKVVRFQN